MGEGGEEKTLLLSINCYIRNHITAATITTTTNTIIINNNNNNLVKKSFTE
jgi:hypothetical protein